MTNNCVQQILIDTADDMKHWMTNDDGSWLDNDDGRTWRKHVMLQTYHVLNRHNELIGSLVEWKTDDHSFLQLCGDGGSRDDADNWFDYASGNDVFPIINIIN